MGLKVNCDTYGNLAIIPDGYVASTRGQHQEQNLYQVYIGTHNVGTLATAKLMNIPTFSPTDIHNLVGTGLRS